MRFFLLFVVLFQISLNALTISQNSKKDSVNSPIEIDLKEIKDLFKQKKYKQSIKILEPLSLKVNDNKVNFYLGRAYYNIKDYEMALSMYERILISDESLLRVRLEFAQTYLMLQMKKESLFQFKLLLKNKDLPKNVRQNIINRIKYIHSKERKHFLTFNLGIDYIHDNNINNRSNADSYNIYSPIVNSSMTIQTQGDKESDTALSYNFSGSYYYKLNNIYTIENTLYAFHQKYKKFSEKKTQSLSLNSYLAKSKQNYKVSYGLDYSFIRYNDEKLQETLGFGVQYQRKLSSNKNVFSIVKFFQKNYFESVNKDKESHNLNLILGQSFKTKKYGTINNLLMYTKEDKLRGQRTDVDQNSYGIVLSQNYNITQSLSSSISCLYKEDRYEKEDVNFLIKRIDKTSTFTAGLTKKIDKKTSLSIGFINSIVNSNHKPFDYKKQSSRMSMRYKF